MEFNVFKTAIQKQFSKMAKSELFVTDVSKDDLWDTYLASFPEGTNPVFRERTEYDCQCCKQFIRACGNVVAIVDNQLVSIWDIEIGEHFQVVSDALSGFVKSATIKDTFLHREKKVGTDSNHQLLESGDTLKWEHFYFELPNKFVEHYDSIGSILSDKRSNKEVLERSLKEITIDAAETVLELIEQNSIYRGEENKATVKLFIKHKVEFDFIDDKDNYCWTTSMAIGGASKIRNTAIGTLLVDISDGKGLDEAVKMFESKVAPENYKRPTALITKSMIEKAQKKCAELGIEASLKRRYAVTEDITINNVLFADRTAKKEMNVFDEMINETSTDIKKLKKVEEIDIETFINDVVPKADSIEMMLENKHVHNLMSLIAPIDKESKNILKWDNNFSWAYNGEVADSMKDRVKKAGGKVDGVLRFSIQWNEENDNQDDLDAHCVEPCGNLIYYSDKDNHRTTGNLDVDIISPGNKVAVENITWSNINKMGEGKYKFLVHDFSKCGGKSGFSAEIEYDGQIYSYEYSKPLRSGQKVTVAEIEFSREKGIKFIKSLPSTTATKEVWGITTNKFHKVRMIMNSPNHWDGNKTGNKHHFFVLEDCKNDGRARGFFNEFLNEDLREHRKVFEVLGSKMKAEKSDTQLSGLGFSSTQKNQVLCNVTGSFTRTLRVNF